MFIAMNRFKVIKGLEEAFEHTWTSRTRRLHEMPGFISFHFLKGPESEDHVLYASHTSWETKEHFLDWTNSEQFRDAHKNAGHNKPLYLDRPQFEGFETVISENNPRYAPQAAE